MATPTIEDLWLVVRALHRDLDRLNDRIIHLEGTLMPALRDDIVRLPNSSEESEPPGWVSPSEAQAPRSDPAWKSASGS